jgi:hypothetical protein
MGGAMDGAPYTHGAARGTPGVDSGVWRAGICTVRGRRVLDKLAKIKMHALPALASQRILRRSLFGDIDKNTF